ncbi:Importin-5 [Psilocybe cubensis]|uniref:Uncharacterized protein n=2 Tax=Psilocybe cubensis TaxID=181762 RepID=A0A8H8CHV2_PSICU|nr:Importin-5 [Psilocybe cubensis]KAH9479020.1 Importin-5 [Psilocybe cubensis]
MGFDLRFGRPVNIEQRGLVTESLNARMQCIDFTRGDLLEDIKGELFAMPSNYKHRFHRQLFAVLIPALEDPEPRVHAHTASALINFCEGIKRDTLLSYLDPIVKRLLKLLNPGGDQTQVRRYVQEQAITTLAMVADASDNNLAHNTGSVGVRE